MLPGEEWNPMSFVNGWLPTCKHLHFHSVYLMPEEWFISIPRYWRMHFYSHPSHTSLHSIHYLIPRYIQFIQDFFFGFSRMWGGNEPEFPWKHEGIEFFCLLFFIFSVLSFNFYLSQSNSPCQPFILGRKGNRRGFTGGSVRVRRGVPHWTLTEPSLNPHWTPSELYPEKENRNSIKLLNKYAILCFSMLIV